MKLRNKVSVRNSSTAIMVSYSFLGATVVGLITLIYFNFRGADSFANDSKSKEMSRMITGNDFRVLQNGSPIMPVMGVATNSQGIFEVQVRMGIDLKKEKSKPIGAEISMLRGDLKVNTLKFPDVKELKSKDLQPWIVQDYKPGDKISIELINTILEPSESVKVYSLAAVY